MFKCALFRSCFVWQMLWLCNKYHFSKSTNREEVASIGSKQLCPKISIVFFASTGSSYQKDKYLKVYLFIRMLPTAYNIAIGHMSISCKAIWHMVWWVDTIWCGVANWWLLCMIIIEAAAWVRCLPIDMYVAFQPYWCLDLKQITKFRIGSLVHWLVGASESSPSLVWSCLLGCRLQGHTQIRFSIMQ